MRQKGQFSFVLTLLLCLHPLLTKEYLTADSTAITAIGWWQHSFAQQILLPFHNRLTWHCGNLLQLVAPIDHFTPHSFHETYMQGIMVVVCNVSKKLSARWIPLPWFPVYKCYRGNGPLIKICCLRNCEPYFKAKTIYLLELQFRVLGLSARLSATPFVLSWEDTVRRLAGYC